MSGENELNDSWEILPYRLILIQASSTDL